MSSLVLPGVSSGVLTTPGGVPLVPEWLNVEVGKATEGRGRVEWLTGAHQPYFGLKIQWSSGDPRWVHILEGRMPESAAFDLEQMFPKDCSINDMASYVRDRWGDRARSTNTAQDAERIVNESLKAQATVQNDNILATVDRATQHHHDESEHLRNVRAGAEQAHPMVRGGLVE